MGPSIGRSSQRRSSAAKQPSAVHRQGSAACGARELPIRNVQKLAAAPVLTTLPALLTTLAALTGPILPALLLSGFLLTAAALLLIALRIALTLLLAALRVILRVILPSIVRHGEFSNVRRSG
jgi:hypothetical protein